MHKTKPARLYLRMLKDYFKVIPAAGTVTALVYATSGVFPAFTAFALARLFDEAYIFTQSGGETKRIIFFGMLYLTAYVLNSFWGYVSGLIGELGADKIQVYYRYQMCVKLSKMPLIGFENTEIKEKQARAEHGLYNGYINSVIRSSFDLVLFGVLNVVSVSAVLVRYNILFLPLCVLSVLPYFIARLVRGKEFYYIKHRQAKKERKLAYFWGLFTDRRTVKELRAAGADGYIFDKWTQTRIETQEELWEQTRKDALSLFLCDVLRIAGYGACVALALMLTLRGSVSVGVFGACIAAFSSLQTATRVMLQQSGNLPMSLSFAGDYFTFTDLPEEKTGGVDYPGLREKIELQDVSFAYPNSEKQAVKNVRFDIGKGEKIAVLGENGSGKTTLIKLILGFYPLKAGAVLYDGTEVSRLDKTPLYKTVSVVAQNFTQYRLPLRDNIAMSEVGSINDDERIIEALTRAGLGDLSGDAGLDGELGVGFGGGDISGGQWQKLAIARGLFRDSELIILDEPTSALDPLIETEILSQFIELARDKTAIIISHRVGLCRLVDRIAVMKDGELVETGSHDELLAKGGEYTRLFTAQEKWYR